MPVTEVGSLPELNNILERSDANRLIIIDFFANWCGPCRMISPIFEQFSAEYGNATFLKVNCDVARDIVQRYNISAMPTFIFLKNRQQVDMVRGANQQAIAEKIRQHYSPTPANPNAASDSEKRFLEQFVKCSNVPRSYQDEVFKALARSVMPEELVGRAMTEGPRDEKAILKDLLHWFKTQFFTWFDRPTCPKCTLKCSTDGLQGTPTREEQKEGGASRVEVYICDGCNTEMRFPRYNNPAKLLQTRTGRCGEWANCFGLLLAALNLESRFIYDTTDHVWNEVYLLAEQRWCHVDPCENTMDRPLLYTRGWGKTLGYCIGYGSDHVVDVTWRYIWDSKKLVTQRNEVRQPVFENFLSKLNSRQAEGQTEPRKRELAVRRVCELMEMMAQEAKNHKIGWEKIGDDLGGRITGSEEWRRERGELGESGPKLLAEPIKLAPPTGPAQNYLEFNYDVITDTYSQPPEIGFSAQAFELENVQRVEETDWNMTYLCRKRGDAPGNISWHFDLKSLKKSIEKIEIRMAGIQKFEKGKAMAIACLGDSCMRLPIDCSALTIEDPKNAEILKITATLSGGEGAIGFQQAQIFRTELKRGGGARTESFSVKIWMKN